MDGRQELIGDPRDRDVGDLELLLAEQMEQQVERPGESVELDDEAGAGAERGGGGLGRGHEKMFHPSPTLNGRISRSRRHQARARRREQERQRRLEQEHQSEQRQVSEATEILGTTRRPAAAAHDTAGGSRRAAGSE